MIETFKIIRGIYDQEVCEDIFEMREGPSTRGHDWRIFKKQVRLNVRKNSFPIRVVNNWNNLNGRVTDSATVDQFKRRLDQAWAREDQRYNFQAKIEGTRARQDTPEEVDLESQAY